MCLVLCSFCEGQGRVVFFVGHGERTATCFSGADPSALVADGRQRRGKEVGEEKGESKKEERRGVDVELVSVGLRGRGPRLVDVGCRGCCWKGQHSNPGAQCKHSHMLGGGRSSFQSGRHSNFEFTSILQFTSFRQLITTSFSALIGRFIGNSRGDSRATCHSYWMNSSQVCFRIIFAAARIRNE
jgi:hypothetical protein